MNISYLDSITWDAMVETAVRDREQSGPRSQADIDRLPVGHVPSYANQLAGKIATGQLPARSVWCRVKGWWNK